MKISFCSDLADVHMKETNSVFSLSPDLTTVALQRLTCKEGLSLCLEDLSSDLGKWGRRGEKTVRLTSVVPGHLRLLATFGLSQSFLRIKHIDF